MIIEKKKNSQECLHLKEQKLLWYFDLCDMPICMLSKEERD